MITKKKWNKKELLAELKKRVYNLNRKPTKRDFPSIYSSLKKYFGSWNNALREIGLEVKTTQKPNIPVKLTPDLSYFLGLLITDGHIVFNNRYKILIFTSYEEEKETIIKLIKAVFNYNPSIRKKRYGFNKLPNYEIYISSKGLANYFVNKIGVPYGAKSKIVRVPKILFKTDEKNIFSFIRGVIDGDGTISPEKKYIRISSGSAHFLLDIKKLLDSINISSGKISEDKRGNIWILGIAGISNIRKLGDLVYSNSKFFYPRKKIRWKDI